MGEERIVYPNDTTNALEKMIVGLNDWKQNNPSANPREVAIVITKLEEAALWSLKMAKQS